MRREWQVHRSQFAKQRLINASRKLSNALRQEEKNAQRRYIEQLSTSSSENSLWKAYPSLTTPAETISPLRTIAGGSARSDKRRATTFATHLQHVFQPNPATSSFVIPTLTDDNQTPNEPIEFRANEIEKMINVQLNP